MFSVLYCDFTFLVVNYKVIEMYLLISIKSFYRNKWLQLVCQNYNNYSKIKINNLGFICFLQIIRIRILSFKRYDIENPGRTWPQPPTTDLMELIIMSLKSLMSTPT